MIQKRNKLKNISTFIRLRDGNAIAFFIVKQVNFRKYYAVKNITYLWNKFQHYKPKTIVKPETTAGLGAVHKGHPHKMAKKIPPCP